LAEVTNGTGRDRLSVLALLGVRLGRIPALATLLQEPDQVDDAEDARL
jgi:hypothetical protein